MALTAGDFWNIKNPRKPYGEFDINARLKFPMDISEILEEMGTTYADHEFIFDDPVELLENGTYDAGVVDPFFQLKPGAVVGTKYPVTIRVVGVDTQQDDRTFYFKAVQL